MGDSPTAARLKSQGIASARELATRTGANTLDLCRAGQALPDVGYAQKCVEQSGHKNPGDLRTLSIAYRAAGKTEQARAAAREGLALLPASSSHIRRLLEEAAQ